MHIDYEILPELRICTQLHDPESALSFYGRSGDLESRNFFLVRRTSNWVVIIWFFWQKWKKKAKREVPINPNEDREDDAGRNRWLVQPPSTQILLIKHFLIRALPKVHSSLEFPLFGCSGELSPLIPSPLYNTSRYSLLSYWSTPLISSFEPNPVLGLSVFCASIVQIASSLLDSTSQSSISSRTVLYSVRQLTVPETE